MSRQARLVISVAAEIIFAAKIYKKKETYRLPDGKFPKN